MSGVNYSYVSGIKQISHGIKTNITWGQVKKIFFKALVKQGGNTCGFQMIAHRSE